MVGSLSGGSNCLSDVHMKIPSFLVRLTRFAVDLEPGFPVRIRSAGTP